MVKKNILILHGWGAETKKLIPLATDLKKRGWNVFLPKIPGFEADPPPYPWSLDEYADCFADWAEKKFKGEEYFVFGHSFGGGVGIKMADKYGAKVRGLILCATRGFSRGSLVKRSVFFVLAKVGKIFLLVPPVAHFWKKVLYKLAREHDYEKTSGVMKETFKKVVREDLRPVLKSITHPLLVLWGEDDKVTPISDALFIEKHSKSAALITYPKSTHNLPYVRYTELSEEINTWIGQLT